MTAWNCALNIYREQGIRGFYKGVTASYYGLSETVIHLVIYEEIKAHFRSKKDWENDDEIVTAWNFLEYMAAAATSKTTASCLCYPHGMFRGCCFCNSLMALSYLLCADVPLRN